MHITERIKRNKEQTKKIRKAKKFEEIREKRWSKKYPSKSVNNFEVLCRVTVFLN